MKAVNLISLGLMIIGSINWGLVGLSNFNLVEFLFHPNSTLTKLVSNAPITVLVFNYINITF